MGTAQVVFVVERCGGATGSHLTGSDLTGSDVSHVTGRFVIHVTCSEVCYALVQPEVAQYPS